MGLDATIKRFDGGTLGNLAQVREALAAAFPDIVFDRLPSGTDKIRAAAEQGIVFPDVIRQHLEASPAEEGGDYRGPDFSAEFFLGSAESVDHVAVVLYGNTTASEPIFALLEERFGWVCTSP
jgi:hypothetical protein